MTNSVEFVVINNFAFQLFLFCSETKETVLVNLVKMPFKSIVREMREGIGSISRRGVLPKHGSHRRTKSHIAPEASSSSGAPRPSPSWPVSSMLFQQSRWANLPPELLIDIIQRVEASETSWPARRDVVACASVCRSWREITKEVVKTPEQCGWLTFPISLKQVIFFLFFIFKCILSFFSFFFKLLISNP